MAVKIGAIFADFTAKTAGFQQGLQQVQDGMKKTRKVVDDNTTSIKAGFASINKVMGTLGVGISVGAIISGLRSIGNELSELKDRATELNVSTTEFQALEYAAEYNQDAIKALSNSLTKLEIEIQNARNEGGTAAKVFKDMGVNLDEMAKLSAGQRFAYIAQDIKTTLDPAARFAQWAKLMGERDLLKLRESLDNASVGMIQLTEAAKQHGAIIEGDIIKGYDEFNKRADLLKKGLIGGFFNLMRDASLNMKVMTGNLETMADHLTTAAEKAKFYEDTFKAMASHGGFSEEMTDRVVLLAATWANTARDVEQDIAKITKAENENVRTLGETKDAVIDIGKSYNSLFDRLNALNKLYNDLGKKNPVGNEDNMNYVLGIITATEVEAKKLSQTLLDAAETPKEKFDDLIKTLDQLKSLKYINDSQYTLLKTRLNPTLAESKRLVDEYKRALASVDKKSAFEVQIESINTFIKELASNTNIATDALVELEAKLKKNAKDTSAEGLYAQDVRDYLMTPEEKKQEDIARVNDNSILTDEEKTKAIYDINTGFVEMQANLVRNAELIENDTNAFAGLKSAATAAKTSYNSATSVTELKKVQRELDATKERYDTLDDAGKMAVENLAAGFARLITQGGSVKDMLGGVAQMIAQMFIQRSIMSAFGFGFGGGFAGGGDVNPNKYYVVGENGPELFSPKARGTIINDTQIAARSSGGGSVPVIQFNLSAYDTQGMSQMIDSKTPAIIAQAMRTWKYENSRGKM